MPRPLPFFLLIVFCGVSGLWAQCPACGDGAVDAGETNLGCPQDVPRGASCTSPCGQPGAFETTAGIRISRDFVGNTTYSTAGLPTGWSFAGAPTATTAGALPAADTYGAKAGLVQPNCSGSCTGTNGFCIGNIANSVAVGSGGTGGKLGANFDGRANINQNLSYAVLRGQGSPTLVSESFNFSNVEGFKIQFWLAASESSCGQTNGWGSCTGNEAYLDFSSNGGTTWVQMLRMNISSTNSDMCTNNSTNTLWLGEGRWGRVCLTVFRNTTSPGNFYPAAKLGTAASGMVLDNRWFVAGFRFRIRYEQSASCTSGISTTNPGRYLAIDYPTVTSGNEMIPCGISFANMCGYGADNNDDGVGSSTATTTATAFGTVLRSVNHAERGVEIFASQNASFQGQNLTGSSLPSNHDLCNAEGGDRQCIDWQSNNNNYFVVYECIADWEAASGAINVQYYRGGTAQSVSMTKVTSAGRTALIGWRYSASRFVSCGSLTDLNAGCNGYSFRSGSLPTQFARGFYALTTNNLGESWSYYGATSCSHYFNGPSIAPIALPQPTVDAPDHTQCAGEQLVFAGTASFCSTSSGFSGSATLSVSGPGGFSDGFVSGGMGSAPITVPGSYTVSAQVPGSPAQCVQCGRSVCVNVTAADIAACITVPVELKSWTAQVSGGRGVLLLWTMDLPNEVLNFTVEHSLSGIHWEALATLPNTPPTDRFEYEHRGPLAEGIHYYRLLLRRADGSSEYARIVSVEIPPGAPTVRLYPNPCQGVVSVEGLERGFLELLDALGRSIEGCTINGSPHAWELPDHLPQGLYWLRYTDGTVGGVLPLHLYR